jgi:hypothetical protein
MGSKIEMSPSAYERLARGDWNAQAGSAVEAERHEGTHRVARA